MELYNNSPAARGLLEAADEYLTEIVKAYLKEQTIHLGRIRHQAIRQCYMDMTYNTMDKDRNVKTCPVFGDIDSRTQRCTFSFCSPLRAVHLESFKLIPLLPKLYLRQN